MLLIITGLLCSPHALMHMLASGACFTCPVHFANHVVHAANHVVHFANHVVHTQGGKKKKGKAQEEPALVEAADGQQAVDAPDGEDDGEGEGEGGELSAAAKKKAKKKVLLQMKHNNNALRQGVHPPHGGCVCACVHTLYLPTHGAFPSGPRKGKKGS